MTRLTLAVVGKTMFGADLGCQADAVSGALTVAMDYLHYRLNHLFAPPAWAPTPRNLRFRRALRTLDHVVYGVIAERRRSPGDGADLLATLLAAQDEETGQGMSDRQLRDEVITFLLAGHETVATALTWTWRLLGGCPTAARRLRDEVTTVLGRRTPTAHDLPRLPYTKMVIEETMRLYPPVWLLVRNPVVAGEVGGYHIPARSIIFLTPYCTHRHPEFWKNAEAFEPEALRPGAVGGAAALRIFSFRLRPAPVHRQRVRPHGGAVRDGHDRADVSSASRAGLRRGSGPDLYAATPDGDEHDRPRSLISAACQSASGPSSTTPRRRAA